MPFQDLIVGHKTARKSSGGFFGNLFGGLGKILNFGKSFMGGSRSSGIGSTLLNIVLSGLALRKLYKMNQAEVNMPDSIQEEQPDFGVRLQASADPSTKIPVVYGDAFIGGKLTDVRMTDNNQTMWYCLTLCEVTGTVLSTSTASLITFKDIWYDNSRVVFKANGYTVDYTVDVNGKQDYNLQDLIEIYCFNNGSASPINVEDFTNPGTAATSLMPSWSSTDTMNELVFILVKVKYDKGKNTAGLGTVNVQLRNSMTKPGDCLYDMMVNTRFGASIPATDIKNA